MTWQEIHQQYFSHLLATSYSTMLFLNVMLNISISAWRDLPEEGERIILQSVEGSRLGLFRGHDPDPQRWIILPGYFWLLLDTCTRQSARLYWLNNRRQPKHEWATDKNTGLRCSEDPKALVLTSRRSLSQWWTYECILRGQYFCSEMLFQSSGDLTVKTEILSINFDFVSPEISLEIKTQMSQ